QQQQQQQQYQQAQRRAQPQQISPSSDHHSSPKPIPCCPTKTNNIHAISQLSLDNPNRMSIGFSKAAPAADGFGPGGVTSMSMVDKARRLWEGWRDMEEYAREVFPIEEEANGLDWML
ncbi:hypothetical protein KEM54_004650, partial [Ascosphaera aggregata]